MVDRKIYKKVFNSKNKVMKKVFLVLALAFAGAQMVSAAEVQVPVNYQGVYTNIPSSHPVYKDPDAMVKEVIGYISNLEWDRSANEAASRSGQKLPVIGGGVDITDEAGVVYKNACSQEGVSRHQCVVLTGTKKYHEDMIAMAKAIIAGGQEAAFPRFSGWFKLAK